MPTIRLSNECVARFTARHNLEVGDFKPDPNDPKYQLLNLPPDLYKRFRALGDALNLADDSEILEFADSFTARNH